MSPVRGAIELVARSGAVHKLVAALPLPAAVVREYVAGEGVREALSAVERLADEGLETTVDHLAPDPVDEVQAVAAVQAYRILLDKIGDAGLGRRAEVSVSPTAIGLLLPEGEKLAIENARKICRAAHSAGTSITLAMDDHTTVDATLEVAQALRHDFPETGITLQAHLHRTESDCRALAYAGSRVRICKGADDAPADVAFTDPGDVDRSYVRCMKVLLGGEGYPMLATHDPRLIEIAGALASRYGRAPGTYEYQLRLGVRAAEQRRLVASGERVRVYLPYGEHWHRYVVSRVAEHPQNLSLVLASLVRRGQAAVLAQRSE